MEEKLRLRVLARIGVSYLLWLCGFIIAAKALGFAIGFVAGYVFAELNIPESVDGAIGGVINDILLFAVPLAAFLVMVNRNAGPYRLSLLRRVA